MEFKTSDKKLNIVKLLKCLAMEIVIFISNKWAIPILFDSKLILNSFGLTSEFGWLIKAS
jgi:hypothetical protein